MRDIWNLIFIQPITSSLFYLTDMLGNLGIAIIILTVIIQLLLLPLRLPSLKSAEKLKELKPRMDELKNKHKDDPQAMVKAQMELYREHGVSPVGGILPMLLSLPVIFALYRVLTDVVNNQAHDVTFLWLQLDQPDPYFILPALVAISQFFLTRQMRPISTVTESKPSQQEDAMEAMQKNMQYIFPVMLGIITLRLPAGIGLYFVVSAIFAIIQQVVVRLR